MKMPRVLAVVVTAAALTACGGGGGGGNGGRGQRPTTMPDPKVDVTAAPSVLSGEASVGDAYQAAISGTWSASNIGTGQVWLQVSDSAGTFATPAAQVASGTTFQYGLPLASNIAEGVRKGILSIRACRDAQCAQTYVGNQGKVEYTLQVYKPQVQLTISTPGIVEAVDPGDAYQASLRGTWSGTHLGNSSVYLQVADSAGTFVAPPVAAAPADPNYGFKLALKNPYATGTQSGTLTVRACRDDKCTQPYENAIDSVAYQLSFVSIGDWETFQRNASHDGYVPITLDAANFRKVWEWPKATDPALTADIVGIATSGGVAYLTLRAHFSEAKAYAINEGDGSEKWRISLGTMPQINAPAYHDGMVYLSTTGHENTYLWGYDANAGGFKFKTPFETQWSGTLAPTILDQRAYVSSGYYGGVVYAYDRLTGTPSWKQSTDGDDALSTPAADGNSVYYHSGKSLWIWDRDTGALVANIADPLANPMWYDYNSAPILGSRKNVLAFAGSVVSANQSRVLSSFNIEKKAWEWATSNAYVAQPAVGNGVIYAGRSSPAAIDAIDETTGKLLWTWNANASAGETEIRDNIVVTRNLLFLTTNQAVYAIDLETRKPVWRHPEPGRLAISANRTLYVLTPPNATDMTGASRAKVIAIKLNR